MTDVEVRRAVSKVVRELRDKGVGTAQVASALLFHAALMAIMEGVADEEFGDGAAAVCRNARAAVRAYQKRGS